MNTYLSINERVPSGNEWKRMHYHTYKRRRDSYQWLLRAQTNNRHPGRVRLTVTRYYVGKALDYDNLVGSGKCPLDAVKLAGIIVDDRPEIIVEPIYRQEKVKRNAEQRMTILIEDL